MDNTDVCAYVENETFFDCAKYINSAAALDPKAAVKGDCQQSRC